MKLTETGKRAIIWEAEHMNKGDVILLQNIDNHNIHVVFVTYGGGIGNSWASFKGRLKKAKTEKKEAKE